MHVDLRERELLLRKPVEPYVGLSRGDAERLATSESRHIRVLSSLDGPRRADLSYGRVNVELDEDEVVVRADAG